MAGLPPSGVLCEVVTDDGLDDGPPRELDRFAAKHGLVLVTIADLIRYRRQTERLVWRVAIRPVPTEGRVPLRRLRERDRHRDPPRLGQG